MEMLVGLPMARNIDLSYIPGHQGGWVVIQEMKTVYTVLVDQWHSNGNKQRHFVKKNTQEIKWFMHRWIRVNHFPCQFILYPFTCDHFNQGYGTIHADKPKGSI